MEEIENTLTLSEIELIVTSMRDRDYRLQKFQAALKGIDLDENNSEKEDAEDRFEIIKARAEARSKGVDPEVAEMDFFGIDIETE